MAKRQTIGENPLDGLIQTTTIRNVPAIAVIEEVSAPTQKKAQCPKKQRLTVQISEEVVERVKNAVYWTPGLTLASLAEEALSNAVDQFEKERKEAFPKRQGGLKTGRPVK